MSDEHPFILREVDQGPAPTFAAIESDLEAICAPRARPDAHGVGAGGPRASHLSLVIGLNIALVGINRRVQALVEGLHNRRKRRS
jgi:hypothetical protein